MSRASRERKRAAHIRKRETSGKATAEEGFSTKPINVDRPIVAVLVPCYKQPHPRMQHAFTLMAEHARLNGIQVFAPPLLQSSVVHWTRNSLIRDLIKSRRPFTHVLFLDDDIVPSADGLTKLLRHGKAIVAALCTKRQDPPIPNARLYDAETGVYQELWEWPDGLIDVDAVGTGMMLIAREALQKVADAYLGCLYEKKVYAVNPEWIADTSRRRTAAFDADANGWWFRFLPKEDGAGEYGEDISFCHMARRYCEIPIHVDTTIQPEHMGDYGYSIADFIAHRDPLIARAKAEGRYLGAPSAAKVAESRIVIVD